MYLSVHIGTIYNSQDVEATQAFERVTGRKARGLQTEEIGRKCQTFFISPLSSGGNKLKCQIFFPSPYKIERSFLFGNVFLKLCK